ncbi:transcriptional regulator [Salipaludibacillus neizhouensis]|uniref:Transcriptional regulator n=1 Tax=Salipaludibacillus neizhouensis TaxID=885475 RepID=A0A3A9K181_9BACI|nr:cyclic-di-AMP receptor [Salipaludibacillus neizhouensis]RKL66119.1 transcriptional regulator [Salipaludibacillus neizhouensis]
MKLMVCVVQNYYRVVLEEGLKENGYRMTELASSGGFLKRGNTTFLIGIKDTDIENLKERMKEICLAYEKKKGKSKGPSSRYISFLIQAKDALPLMQQEKNP